MFHASEIFFKLKVNFVVVFNSDTCWLFVQRKSTALHIAAHKGVVDSCSLLIEYGADLAAKDAVL